MFDEEFWQSKHQSKDITVGWLYNHDIRDDFAKGYTKNLTDYWSVELAYFFKTQFADDTIYGLLKKAYDAGFSSILVLKQGCTFRGCDFLPEFKKFFDANSDVKFIGHILDRADGYYEVNPQTFFIDLNWWATRGFPKWGEKTRDSNSPLKTLETIRSKENHHGQYTPYWVAPGKNLKTYQGQRGQGWNIVKALIESGEKILSWPHTCRVLKQYAYAEVTQDAPRHRAELLEEINQDPSCFVANTENFPDIKPYIKQRRNFQQVVTPASGISTLIFAFKMGLKPKDKIVIYDISKFAIEYAKRLTKEWDANTSYSKFVIDQMNRFNGNYRGVEKLNSTEDLINELNKEGFSEWVNNDLKEINITTIDIDLYDEPRHKDFLKCIDSSLMTYFHFTNIFHYMPSSFYYSLRQKWQLSNDLLVKIKKEYTNNNALIYMSRGRYYNNSFSPLFWIEDADTKDFSEISENNIFRLLKWNK